MDTFNKEEKMAKVSKEIYYRAKKENLSVKQIADICGVTKQAVCAMFKKYSQEPETVKDVQS